MDADTMRALICFVKGYVWDMDLLFAMELVEYPTSIFDNEDVFLVYFFIFLFFSFFLSFFLSSSTLFGAGICR
jgi:hypothetical protein